MYQHDHPSAFRFRLIGELDRESAAELEHAWHSAASVLKKRDLIVDLSAVTFADRSGLDLLVRMKEAGAQLIGSKIEIKSLAATA